MALKRQRVAILISVICAGPILLLGRSCPGAETPRDAAQKQWQYATGLLRAGIYYEAAREFGLFVEQNPTHENAGDAAYYRAWAYYEYDDTPPVRAAARKAVADFQKNYPNHRYANLGYFLLGEIAMEEAFDLEREIGARRRNDQPVAKQETAFRDACREARPNYQKFIEMTDLSAYVNDPAALEEMTRRVVTARYNLAQCLTVLKQWDQAIDVYRDLVNKPEFADWGRDEAQYMIGKCYYEWGRGLSGVEQNERLEQAMAEYKRVMFFGHGDRGWSEFSDDARMGEAWCLFYLTRYSDCRKLLEENWQFFGQVYATFKDNPNGVDERWVRSLEPDWYYLYAKCFFEDKDYAKAKEYFEKVIDYQGDNPWKAEATRMHDECIARIGKEIPLETADDAKSAFDVAKGKYETGRYLDAAADFEQIWRRFKAVRQWPLRGQLLFYWGKSLYRSGDEAPLLEAAQIFYQAAKLSDRREQIVNEEKQPVRLASEALFWEGLSYWSITDGLSAGEERDDMVENAMHAFERLAVSDPSHPKTAETLLNVGNFYLLNKQYYSATLAYQFMVDKFPQHADCHKALLNMIYAYSQLEQYDAAIRAANAYEAAYPRQPDLIRAIDYKGAALMKLAQAAGDKAKAAEAAGDAAAASAAAEQERGYYANAAAEYARLRPESFPWLTELQREQEYGGILENAVFYTAYAYRESGEPAKALETYQAFLDVAKPDNTFLTDARNHTGEMLFEEGRYSEAADALRPLADSLDEKKPDDKAYRGMATLVQALLKMAESETDAAKQTALYDEAARRAARFYAVYAATPIHHDPYLKIAEAFRAAERFDQMLEAYAELRKNQRVRLRDTALTGDERRKAYGTYTQLLFVSGEAVADVADLLAERKQDTKKFDVAAGVLLSEHLDRAKKLLGPGKIPANAVEVYFRIGKILSRAGEPEEAANAFKRIMAYVPEKDPRFLKAYYERGNTWLANGYPERALASYYYIVDNADKSNPQRDYFVALARYRIGRARESIPEEGVAKAREAYEALIEEFKDSEDGRIQETVALARKRLQEL